MNKILFPTDFSDNAKNAFHYALKIANKIGAKIDVIHIYSVVFGDVASLPSGYAEQLINGKKNAVNKQLETFVSETDPQFIDKIHAIYGLFPSSEISDHAKKEEYDYIIMGTKGAQNPIDRIMGTITTSVIMTAPCPVIAVPEFSVFKDIKTIALAISFAIKNDYAIKQLEHFAKQIQADIHLVHIDKKGKNQKPDETIENNNYTEIFSQLTVVHHSSVTQGLETFVEKYQIDMLALYIPNRRLWESIFHQSISKRMALHTKTPLIIYHE